MSFGFSVGDFITVGKLIADIINCLQDSTGSASEYQELLRELVALDGVLRALDKLQAAGDAARSLDAMKCAALTCRVPLQRFLNKINKLDSVLSVRGQSNCLVSAARKLEWRARFKVDAVQLRSYLTIHIGIINTLLLEANLHMTINTSNILNQHQRTFLLRFEELSQQACEITSKVDNQCGLIRNTNDMLATLADALLGSGISALPNLANLVAVIW